MYFQFLLYKFKLSLDKSIQVSPSVQPDFFSYFKIGFISKLFATSVQTNAHMEINAFIKLTCMLFLSSEGLFLEIFC